MLGQRRQISDAFIHRVGTRLFLRAGDTGNVQFLGILYEVFHEVIVFRHVFPHIIGIVMPVRIAVVYKRELHAEEVLVCPLDRFVIGIDLVALHDLVDHVLELLRVTETERVDDIVVQLVRITEHQKKLVVVFRPLARDDVVLCLQKLLIVHHLEEDIHVCV